MHRHLERNIPVCKSSTQCLNILTYEFFKEFSNVYFAKLLEDHIIPTDTDINEKTVDGKFGANGTNMRFTCSKNRFLYLGKTMKL